MKYPLLCMLGLLASVLLTAAETSRTWTDKFGRTLSATFVNADTQEITVRRDDGSTVNIPRDKLSDSDLAYADKAQANKPIAVTIEASRISFGPGKEIKSTNGQTLTAQPWGYSVTVSNTSSLVGQNLRADYQIYSRKGNEPGKPVASGALSHQAGTATIDKITARGSVEFRMTSVALATVQLKPGYVWENTDSTEVMRDTLEGIWVRIFQNDTLVGEFVSSDTIRKSGWPEENPASPASKKTVKKPAT